MEKTFSMSFGILCFIFVQIAIHECKGETMFLIKYFIVSN